MALTNVKHGKRKPKNRSNKIHLVFDEAKRRDFLTGFHKRKLQRKKQAQEKLEKELKEERKRLKAEAKESYKKLVVSHRDIPELEHLLSNEYEDDDVTVKVVELSASNIAKQNNWIGINQPKYDESDNDENSSTQDTEEIPGMELNARSKKLKNVSSKKFESEKQIKKELKKKATKNVQKSKVFQRKYKIDSLKQKKQTRIKKQKESTSHHPRKRKGHKKHKNRD